MSRLIDADRINFYKATVARGMHSFDNVEIVEKIQINRMPTIDPESLRPAVHAQWVEYKRAHYFKCSSCKKPVPYRKAVQINGTREYNFCPYCGAKMEGGHNP